MEKLNEAKNKIKLDEITGLYLAKVFGIIIDELYKMEYIDSESIFKLLKIFEKI